MQTDGWIKTQAMIISQKCALCCWSTVFQRSRRCRRLPLVHRLLSWGDLWREQMSRLNCDLHCRWEESSSVYRQLYFEPGSARFFSTPPLYI